MPGALDRILAVLGIALVLATGAVALFSDKAGSVEQSAGGAPPGGPVTTNRVKITDFKYKPADVEVKVGSKVDFVNDDTAAHTATSKGSQAFDTGSIRRGESKSVIPEKAGDFDYYCAFHPFMEAKIRVVD